MPTPNENSVTLYVVPGCPLCAHSRDWLKQHNVSYIERDVAESFAAFRRMYKLTQQRLVPVVEIGDQALVRPDKETLRNLLL